MRALAFAFLLLAIESHSAEALLLSCFPQKTSAPVQLDTYVDGFVPGAYPPKSVEAVRVLARFGAEVYEFDPGHTQDASFKDGVLRIRLVQPLSAGETVELRFEGKLAAQKGEQFAVRVFIRNERRSGEGEARCVVD